MSALSQENAGDELFAVVRRGYSWVTELDTKGPGSDEAIHISQTKLYWAKTWTYTCSSCWPGAWCCYPWRTASYSNRQGHQGDYPSATACPLHLRPKCSRGGTHIVSTVRIELTSGVIWGKTNAGLVEMTGDLDISFGSHKLLIV